MAKRQESSLATLYRTQDPNSENPIIWTGSASGNLSGSGSTTISAATGVPKSNSGSSSAVAAGTTSQSTGSTTPSANSNSSATPNSAIRADGYDPTGMPEWVVLNNAQREASGMNTVNYNANTGKFVDDNYVPVYSSQIDYGRDDLNPAFVERITSAKGNDPTKYEGYVAADPMGSDHYAQLYGMSSEDQASLKTCGENYNAAQNDSARAYWHAQAEKIRANYGYSGGEDGSQNLAVPPKEPTPSIQSPIPSKPSKPSSGTTSSGTTSSGSSTQTGNGSASSSNYDLSEYIKQQAAAQLESNLADLKYAFEETASGYNAAAAQVPKTYQAGRNQAAAQTALAQQNFNEFASAAGLSSGAGAQAQLARNSAYQRTLAELDTAQANALSQIEQDKASLKAQYENAVAQAKSAGNANLSSALYQEMARVQQLQREDAQLAQQMELAREQFRWQQTMDQQQMELAQKQADWNQVMDRWQMEQSQKQTDWDQFMDRWQMDQSQKQTDWEQSMDQWQMEQSEAKTAWEQTMDQWQQSITERQMELEQQKIAWQQYIAQLQLELEQNENAWKQTMDQHQLRLAQLELASKRAPKNDTSAYWSTQ